MEFRSGGLQPATRGINAMATYASLCHGDLKVAATSAASAHRQFSDSG
jgi:hypothetical protein